MKANQSTRISLASCYFLPSASEHIWRKVASLKSFAYLYQEHTGAFNSRLSNHKLIEIKRITELVIQKTRKSPT